MATILDRAPVIRLSRLAVVAIATSALVAVVSVPFVVGWLAGQIWNAGAWGVAAVKAGWRDARAPTSVPGGS